MAPRRPRSTSSPRSASARCSATTPLSMATTLPRRSSRPASSCRPSTNWSAPARSHTSTSPCSAHTARGRNASLA
eukprot:8706528-Alexandrium_andersonii.AAC.1